MALPPSIPWPAFARHALQAVLHGGTPDPISPPAIEFQPFGGVFVTLYKLDALRGCMGVLDPNMELPAAVRAAAIRAALDDPRFTPLSPTELPHVWIEVSILSPPWRMRAVEELEPGRHGVIVRQENRRGLFLPQVAVKYGLDAETLLARCCHEKAGLPAGAWRDPAVEIQLFTTEVWTERPASFEMGNSE